MAGLRSRGAWLLAAALCAAAARLDAQIGLSTDIITGTVTDESGAPLAGAVVEVFSLETQVTRTVRTDARGRYTVVFPDGGGQYRVRVRYLGKQPQETLLQRFADEDRLVWDVRLTSAPVILEEFTVRAPPRPVRAPDLPTPGSTERLFTTEMLNRLPVDREDLNLLASLVPGTVVVPESDSTPAGFSVAGLRLDANSITLDGLTFSSGSVPQEAVRATRVVTSTYDVARGQFSGGLIASTTRSGTNIVQGSSGYSLRDEDLAITDDPDSPFSRGFTQHVFSGGLGGPLVKDRLFVFGSAQARLRTDAQQHLLSATASDLLRLGLHPDSLNRFLEAVETAGVSPTIVSPEGNRDSDNFSGLVRLDYLVNHSHTLTLRGDLRKTSQEPARLAPLALPQTGGLANSSAQGVMAALTSRLGASLISEFRAYVSSESQDSRPLLDLPAGRVQVASELPEGGVGVSTVSFGGNAALPYRSDKDALEAVEEISWLPGTGRHRIKLGALLRAERSSELISNNVNGTFFYNSLADLEQGRAAVFRRTLLPADRAAKRLDYAVYLGDVWRASRSLQLTYGLRFEGATYPDPPPFNPEISALFGRRTDRIPPEIHLSPRIGFTWTIPGSGVRGGLPGQPGWIVRGGVGEFRSPLPSGLLSAVHAATGLAASEAQVVCVGGEVPQPRWEEYLRDPSSVPSGCVSGGGTAPLRQPAPNVTLFAGDFAAPRAWRASLGFQRFLTSLLRLSVDFNYARGVSQYGFRDLNLRATPYFNLPAEAGRPVYVAPSDIAPVTGAVRFAGSRVHPEFGHVLEAASDLGSESKQLSVSLGGVTRRGVVLQLSYTWSQSRDQFSASRFGASGFGALPVAGDPAVREWAFSDFDRRHSVVGTLSYGFSPALELTAIGRFVSGAPFTPMVGSDINGDGARNDRAFIFDPASGTAEGAAMGRLLESAPSRIRECLSSQIGMIAERNSCRGPWQSSFDLQLNYRPGVLGLGRRLQISVVTVNLLRGIDELLHGSEGARGWGLALRPDPMLLYVTGFDPVERRFVYAVNERFGATGSGANVFRAPFQIGIQARFTIGPDRARAALDGLRGFGPRGGMRPGALAGGTTPAAARGEFLSRFYALLPNPPRAVLELRDSLGLTGEQVSALQALADTLSRRMESLGDSLFAALERRGGRDQNPAELLALVRPQFEAGREQVRWSLERIGEILTLEQWNRLPDRIRNPTNRPARPRPEG
ncbi:MAG: hypothetical protein KatS3mg081_2445 [Gemmatimonadales bacterium]|nr:MAG: hypothetical protein KatS3mg081_2445 [Gemmatimonadales bacterium]